MDSDKPEAQAQSCFMCQQAGPGGCLECRTHRLIADIKTSLYERLGAKHNQSEWEERALIAEAALITEAHQHALDMNALRHSLSKLQAALAESEKKYEWVSQNADKLNISQAMFKVKDLEAALAASRQEVERLREVGFYLIGFVPPGFQDKKLTETRKVLSRPSPSSDSTEGGKV